MRKRGLFTNFDDAFIAAKASFNLAGIDEIVSRDDLVSRTLAVDLLPVQNRSKQEIERVFKVIHPYLLGALFDAASLGLSRIDVVRQDRTWERTLGRPY